MPLLAARLPGVITPLPFANTPVRAALLPVVMVAGLETKLEMEGGGGGAGALDPPQPVKPARPRPARPRESVMAQGETTKPRFMEFPVRIKLRSIGQAIIRLFGQYLCDDSGKTRNFCQASAGAGRSSQPLTTARMSLVSRMRFLYPCFATASIAWPISRVVRMWLGSAQRRRGISGLRNL